MPVDPRGREVNSPYPACYAAATNEGPDNENVPHPLTLTIIGADSRAGKGMSLRGISTKILTPLGDAIVVADNARRTVSCAGGPQWRG